MLRSTRLLILFSVFVVTVALFLLTIPSVAQSDIELTATKIISDATQTSIAFGTPIPPEIRAATMQSALATRTAIAITREPYLLTPQTPDAIELTATRIMANYELTMTAYATPKPGELDPIYVTATFIVQRATLTSAALTANPSLGLTLYPTKTASCEMGLGNRYQMELSIKIGNALQDKAGIPTALADVVTSGVGNQCDEFYPLKTDFHIEMGVQDISDNHALIDLTERILGLLQNFPPEPAHGKTIRLEIVFRGDAYQRKFIVTGYANAFAAYAEGLRGDALIEALGGILDG